MAERVSIGTTNAARYLIHFVSLDGFPSKFQVVQSTMRKPLQQMFSVVGIDVLSTDHTRQPFSIDEFPMLSPDGSYWGPATMLFVLPAVVIGLFRYRQRPFVIAFTIAGLAYFLCQSYSSLYDPWRGRSFVNLGVFLAPLVGCVFLQRVGRLQYKTKRYQRAILLASSIVVISAGVAGVAKRAKHTSRALTRSKDRIELISRGFPTYIDRYHKYESLVPPGSTVLLSPNTSFEQHYLVYGEKLNRRIIFNESAADGKKIDFKIIASKFETPLPTDIPLDEVDSPSYDGRWYLRPLHGTRVASRSRPEAALSTENR